MEDWAEECCDQIDAGFFSGDTFQSDYALDRIQWYVGRWQRAIADIRAAKLEDEAP